MIMKIGARSAALSISQDDHCPNAYKVWLPAKNDAGGVVRSGFVSCDLGSIAIVSVATESGAVTQKDACRIEFDPRAMSYLSEGGTVAWVLGGNTTPFSIDTRTDLAALPLTLVAKLVPGMFDDRATDAEVAAAFYLWRDVKRTMLEDTAVHALLALHQSPYMT